MSQSRTVTVRRHSHYRILASALLMLSVLAVPGRVAAATWSIYYNTSAFVPVYSFWAGTGYLNMQGEGMSSCSSGWTVAMMVMSSGGHQAHNVQIASSVCGGSYGVVFGHIDSGYRAMCTNLTGGNETANCRKYT
ncbi:MAG: hypothetical protein FD127_2786 [Acidimicrobiaceae bacterium]|nr:MAG: hypothetical protein FD127_2786 [Acidimicrobiaceae bacterium]